MEGFLPDHNLEADVEEQAAQFLLLRQQEQAVDRSLWPHHISVEPTGQPLVEGETVTLHVCLQVCDALWGGGVRARVFFRKSF